MRKIITACLAISMLASGCTFIEKREPAAAPSQPAAKTPPSTKPQPAQESKEAIADDLSYMLFDFMDSIGEEEHRIIQMMNHDVIDADLDAAARYKLMHEQVTPAYQKILEQWEDYEPSTQTVRTIYMKYLKGTQAQYEQMQFLEYVYEKNATRYIDDANKKVAEAQKLFDEADADVDALVKKYDLPIEFEPGGEV